MRGWEMRGFLHTYTCTILVLQAAAAGVPGSLQVRATLVLTRTSLPRVFC
jgi:hypothetical protein